MENESVLEGVLDLINGMPEPQEISIGGCGRGLYQAWVVAHDDTIYGPFALLANDDGMAHVKAFLLLPSGKYDPDDVHIIVDRIGSA